MGTVTAVLDKEGVDATEAAVTMLDALSPAKTDNFGLASPSSVIIESTIDALRNLHLNSNIIVGYRFSRIFQSDRPQPTRLKDAAMVFDGRTYPSSDTFHHELSLIKPLHDVVEAAETFIRKSYGDYAFVLAEKGRLVAGRDPIGARPLYYGENNKLAALASERKALWRIGVSNDSSFPPGNTAVINQTGLRFKPVKTLSCSELRPITMGEAAWKLEKLLKHSVTQRVSGLNEAAIGFSGGLDSCVIAQLAQKVVSNVQLVHVSLENQEETEHAREAADTLKLPIHACVFREEDVRKDLPMVLRIIEEDDPVKTAIGIPIYWAARQASRMGFNVMLAGQGADELFGGYRRYVNDYLAHGKEAVSKRIFEDVARLCENNLERDFKICGFHGVEMRLPFATVEMAEFALSLPINLKIDPEKTDARKLVLRKTAENMGLPESISRRPKKAVQYATGVDKALKRLAKQEGSVKVFLRNEFRNTLREAA
jgi:asparagine synthase (glutamine-hydrolysing)